MSPTIPHAQVVVVDALLFTLFLRTPHPPWMPTLFCLAVTGHASLVPCVDALPTPLANAQVALSHLMAQGSVVQEEKQRGQDTSLDFVSHPPVLSFFQSSYPKELILATYLLKPKI